MLSVEYRNALSLFLQIHSTKTGIHVYPETFSRIFIAALFLIVNNWKQAWYQGRWNKYHELWYLKIHIPYLNSASPRVTRTFLCLLIWQSWVQTFSEKKILALFPHFYRSAQSLAIFPAPILPQKLFWVRQQLQNSIILFLPPIPHYLVSYSCFTRLAYQHHVKRMVTPFNLAIPFFFNLFFILKSFLF